MMTVSSSPPRIQILHQRAARFRAVGGAIGIVLWMTAIGLLSTIGCGVADDSPPPPGRDYRWVVLVVLDTYRGDLPSLAGGMARTPCLDQLAARGAVFEQGRSTAPLTGPSHASLLTGTYWTRHGIFENARVLGDEHETLAERLGGMGFETAAAVSLGVLRSEYGFNQGFSLYDDTFDAQWWKTAGDVNLAIIPWIESRANERTFLWVHYSDTHGPYTPPDRNYDAVAITHSSGATFQFPLDGRTRTLALDDPVDGEHRLSLTGPEAFGDVSSRWFVHSSRGCRIEVESGLRFREGQSNRFTLTLPAQMNLSSCTDQGSGMTVDVELTAALDPDSLRRAYADEAEYLDSQMCRLFHAIERVVPPEETLVVVVGDHGEGLGDHGVFKHGKQVYDSLIHVPFVVVAPGITAPGTSIAEPVSTVDIVPTILDVLGSAADDRLHGHSLFPLLVGRGSEGQRPQFARAFHGNGRFNLEAVVLDRWKLIRNRNTGGMELYDLIADPGELSNLAGSQPDTVQQLQSALDDLLSRGAVESEGTLSEDERRGLEALGYLDH